MKKEISNRWFWLMAIAIIFVVGINELEAEKVKARSPEDELTDPGVEGKDADHMYVSFSDAIIEKMIEPPSSKQPFVELSKKNWAKMWGSKEDFSYDSPESGAQSITLKWTVLKQITAAKFPMRAGGKLAIGKASGGGKQVKILENPTWKIALRDNPVDLDVDSNNNNRYKKPEYDDAEDDIEENSPGKVIMLNVDDDDGDKSPDNSDDKIEDDAKDSYKDLPPMQLRLKSVEQLGTDFELYLELSDYEKLRVFNANGDHLIGIEKSEPLKLEKAHFANGILNMKLEGVKIGEVNIAVVTKDNQILDKVLINVADTLEVRPFNFRHIMQRRDSAIPCPPCLKNPVIPLPNHPHDRPHKAYSDLCAHCSMYCTRASIYMMNHFYKGFVSQDNISENCHKEGMKQYWGENDTLGHGDGLQFVNNWIGGGKSVDPLPWALNLDKQHIDKGQTWQFIADAIITYRPVCMIWKSGAHSSAICGAKIEAGTKRVRLADPQEKSFKWIDFSKLNTIVWVYAVKDDKHDSVEPKGKR